MNVRPLERERTRLDVEAPTRPRNRSVKTLQLPLSIVVAFVSLSARLAFAAEGSAKPVETIDSISVPDGMMVERVAGPPLVDRPIMASFDDRGRLYVSDSAGVNLPGDRLVKNPPHRIVVLQDRRQRHLRREPRLRGQDRLSARIALARWRGIHRIASLPLATR